MLHRSVQHDAFRRQHARLGAWFAENPPAATGRGAFAALAADLKAAAAARTVGGGRTRINYEVPGTRSLFTSTARGRAAGGALPRGIAGAQSRVGACRSLGRNARGLSG
jgi:putative spermidine/putrescine transport system permease protein